MAKKNGKNAHGGLGDLAELVADVSFPTVKDSENKKEQEVKYCLEFLKGAIGVYSLFGIELEVEVRRSAKNRNDEFVVARFLDCEHDHPIAGTIPNGVWWPLEQLRPKPEFAGFRINFPDHRAWHALSGFLHCEDSFVQAASRYWAEREAAEREAVEKESRGRIAAAEEALLLKKLQKEAVDNLDFVLVNNGLWVDTDNGGKKLYFGTLRGDVRIEWVEEGHASGIGKQHEGRYMHLREVTIDFPTESTMNFFKKHPEIGEIRDGLRLVLQRHKVIANDPAPQTEDCVRADQAMFADAARSDNVPTIH